MCTSSMTMKVDRRMMVLLLCFLATAPAWATWRDDALDIVRRSTESVADKQLATLERTDPISRYTIWYAINEYRLSRLYGEPQRRERALRVCEALAEHLRTDDERFHAAQAMQLQSALVELVQMRRWIVEEKARDAAWLTRFDAALARAADDIVRWVPERETMNRASYGGASLQAMVTEFPDHPHVSDWRRYADAVWNDWSAQHDTIEDASGYNALWLITMFVMAEERGEELLPPAALHALLDRWAVQVTPAGTMPDYGDTYFHGANAMWTAVFAYVASMLGDGAYERLARELFAYQQSQFENGVAQDPSHMHWLAWACARPGPSEREPSLHSIVTQRVDRYGRRRLDKIILRDARPHEQPWPPSLALINLFDGGYHGHADAGAVVTLVRSDTVYLHELGYHQNEDRYHNSLLILPPQAPFLERESEFVAGIWNTSVLDLRNPWTYTGGQAPDLAQIDTLFFRVDDEDATNLGAELRFSDILLLGHDKQTSLEHLLSRPLHWSNAERVASSEEPAYWRSRVSFGDDTRSERHWVSLKLDPPLDLSAFERIELRWSMTDNRLDPEIGLQFGLQEAERTQRWRLSNTAAYREVTGCNLVDLTRAAWATISLRLVDRCGTRHEQLRQVVLLKPQGALLVRDTLVPRQSCECQVGQLWHVEEIEERGDNWFIARSEVMYADRDVTWRTNPGRLLVRFFPEAGHEIAAGRHELTDRGRTIAQRWALYDRLAGTLAADVPVSFTCLLSPIDEETPEAEMLWHVGPACLVRIDDDLLLLNPSQEQVHGRIEGDAGFCWAEMEEGALVRCTAEAGALAIDGRTLKSPGPRATVEFEESSGL